MQFYQKKDVKKLKDYIISIQLKHMSSEQFRRLLDEAVDIGIESGKEYIRNGFRKLMAE